MPVGRNCVGPALRSFLPSTDPRWNARSRVEIVSRAWSEEKLGIGSAPWIGDVSDTFLSVPQTATTDQSHRYLFRLASAALAPGRAAVLCGIRQYADLRVLGNAAIECVQVPVYRQIRTPSWSFLDANISWHLRWEPMLYSRTTPQIVDPAQTPDMSTSLKGDSSALLIQSLGPYVPPNAGMPPGGPVEHLGTWNDLRYSWDNTSWDLHIPLHGPGRLVLYCSVHQTNPDTRCPIGVPAAGYGVLGPEDAFVAGYEGEELDVFYGRVGGALVLDLLPEREAQERG